MRAWEHFKTITRHRHLVRRYCFRLGLYAQGIRHDLSKYSPAEFFRGVKYYQGYRSPNDAERRENGVSLAWLHHKGRNRHHYEYWRDIDPATRTYGPVEMPVKYTAEMFCDRVAASMVYRGAAYQTGDPLAYFLRGEAKNLMHPKTAALLESWLTSLAEEGEDAALRRVKAAVGAARTARRRKKNADGGTPNPAGQ